MSEQTGEKTEQPTPRRLEEAFNRGQFAKSSEVQTVAVLLLATFSLLFTTRETWEQLILTMSFVLGHLHDATLTPHSLQGYLISGALIFAKCVWPVVIAAMIGGLLAGGMQSRFQTASEALGIHWERLNPAEGFKRVFSTRGATVAALAIVKLSAIMILLFSEVRTILGDPIFHSSVSAARIAEFLAECSFRLLVRLGLILMAIAAVDYAYQFWKTHRDLMMTRTELKEETKNTEGNPEVKARMRRRKRAQNKRKMLLEVPTADVVVTNPTHLAVALRYDRKTMKAPKIVAKGSRLNALQIREIAKGHQVPILENKPLARLMFRYGRVGGEIPAELYSAVAEVLAWVYRVNRYRYYVESSYGKE